MERLQLKAEIRDLKGKKGMKALRAQNFIPAVVYKGGEDALSIQLDPKDFAKVTHTKLGANAVIDLKLVSSKKSPETKTNDKTVLIKEIQRHPFKDMVLHVDFIEISLSEHIKIEVPIVTKGEAVGVTQDKGVLEKLLWKVQVECLPTEIPEKIEVDITNLKTGDSIFVKDLKVSASIKVLNDPELRVLTVEHPTIEKPKEEVVEGAVEPELIRKEKPEKEEGEEPAKEAEAKKAESKKAESKEEKK